MFSHVASIIILTKIALAARWYLPDTRLPWYGTMGASISNAGGINNTMKALIVHGGAWAIPDDEVTPHIAGCRAAAEAGWRVLQAGGSAREAVVAAVTLMEDDPMFDAGTGSVLNAAGFVELDAALMEGATLRYGAVAGLRRVRNPIALARAVLDGPATLLVGAGAEDYAAAQGMALIDGSELLVERELLRWREAQQRGLGVRDSFVDASAPGDTVGAVALDDSGALVVGNSTGGTPNKPVGRVGDTPLVGCGLYADAGVGACACTGLGETITRAVLAKYAVDRMEQGLSAPDAARAAVDYLATHARGLGGCILLDRAGRVGFAHNTPRMAYAYISDASGNVVAGV
jgi:L-asparaginase / beta-aspartyl-peptidase